MRLCSGRRDVNERRSDGAVDLRVSVLRKKEDEEEGMRN